MRWGRRRQADPPTPEDAPVVSDGSPFAPVTQVTPAGHAEVELEPLPPADAAVEHAPETAPVAHAAEQVSARVAAAVAAEAPHRAGEDDAVDPVDLDVPSTEALPVPAPPRAGRNLWLATATGVVLGVGAIAAAIYHPLVFTAVVYAFAVAAVLEWRHALGRLGLHVSVVPVLLATLGMGVATVFGRGEGLVVALLVACAGVIAWRIVDDRVENTLADSLVGIFTLAWIPFLASFLVLLELADDGWRRVLVVIVAVVLNDTFALFTGMLFGRRKLAPRVSPKKTWEGAIGGAAFGIIGSAVLSFYLFDGRWWLGAAVGAACVVAAVLGDLAESALKRDIAVKDMSSAIPGHGGILDRLDSLLPAAAVAYIVFALLIGTR
ncbi:phosphatidate cytidylyltransferase [Demequina sp. SYSU T00039]|uniref:Phosphatidate cytidylyltransferase n=1 Tax=Demequina lignilytica TaxID=3051663 RepID=A0AAW7LZZ5_9MICO|nr:MULTISPECIES: phosphatidate cytidylyltransferase [unclassified Demequina]MDN4477190.1 phosphatidate cytidylyltransferase [Demequina sp. SYSU T00039-1]MDN4487363.1 phosphatidate cytidylyltransferase [Demequina sp. SYSU T00039]MDN4491116.1 phosphatidate cytidylyltransferase [Demequina sp. SYSU T00068]